MALAPALLVACDTSQEQALQACHGAVEAALVPSVPDRQVVRNAIRRSPDVYEFRIEIHVLAGFGAGHRHQADCRVSLAGGGPEVHDLVIDGHRRNGAEINALIKRAPQAAPPSSPSLDRIP